MTSLAVLLEEPLHRDKLCSKSDRKVTERFEGVAAK